jgi:hypothetical protein
MPTPGRKAGKLLETLLPALLAAIALLLAAPPRDAGAEAQYDRAAAANCSGHAGYAGGATAAPQRYCPATRAPGVRRGAMTGTRGSRNTPSTHSRSQWAS